MDKGQRTDQLHIFFFPDNHSLLECLFPIGALHFKKTADIFKN